MLKKIRFLDRNLEPNKTIILVANRL